MKFTTACQVAVATAALISAPAFAQDAGPVYGVLDTSAPLYAAVPEALKTAGQIRIAMVSDSPPNQYINVENKDLIGVNPDLLKELSKVIGLPFAIEITNFQAQLPGLAAKRYDMIAGPFGDTEERQKSVDFVDYSVTASVAVGKSDSPIYIKTLDDLCGHSMAASTGDVNSKTIAAQSEKCVAEGKPAITLTTYKDIAATWQGVISGREQLLLSTNAIAPYYTKQANGAIKVSSDPLGAQTLAGYMFPKENPELRDLFFKGFEAIIASGAYTEVLKTWGVEAVALPAPMINAGPTFTGL